MATFILDSDMAFDDVLALLFLAGSHEHTLAGVAVEPGLRSVAENVATLEAILDLFDLAIPVLTRPTISGWQSDLSDATAGLPSSSVTLLTTGPVPLLVDALQQLGCLDWLDSAVMMAGDFSESQETEYNVGFDPIAMDTLLSMLDCPLMVSLDVTSRAPLSPGMARAVRALGGSDQRLALISESIEFQSSLVQERHGCGTDLIVHDLVAAVMACNLGAFVESELRMRIDAVDGKQPGRTRIVADEAEGHDIRTVASFDGLDCWDEALQRWRSLA
ncbi:MAG: nucleoside hydrolase [Propionibacteriaceae bacterium]